MRQWLMTWARLVSRLQDWQQRRRVHRAARHALDVLFSAPNPLLEAGRLRPHHRGRINLLDVESDSQDRPTLIVFGIIRHPKSHPLAPRGEEVLEVLEYRPLVPALTVVGARNITRRGDGPPD